MTKTKYYDLQMDDPQDDYDVDVVNANLKKIDEEMKTRENATDALQEPEFTVAAKRENIASKEKMPKILGKIAKFFADLKAVAFTGNYNDLSDKPTSLLANGGNSDTVNSHTVESNVPKNAKFTDTTYSNFVKSGTGAKAGLVPAPSTTAGTTKYLREDGAWKTPPDTKTSIVNNNTTTEPGSALDARQANPNIEGTMAANIQQINSNLNTVFYAIKETKDANNADPGIARMPPNSNLNSKFQIINPDGITKNFYHEKSIGNAGGWFRFFKITYFSEIGAQGATYNHFNVTISQVFNNGLGGNCNFDIIEEYADNPYIIQRYNTLKQIKKFRIVRSGNIIYFDFYANCINNTTIVLINIPFYKNTSNISEASIVKYLIVPDVSDGEKIIKNTNLTTNN